MVAKFNDKFEVSWLDPVDANSVWAIDRIHFAQPVTPLGEDYYREIVGTAWRARTAFANGYLFMKDFNPPPTPPEVLELGAQRIWQEKYLPAVRELCADIRSPDYDAMSATKLVSQLPSLFHASAEAFSYPTVIAATFMGPALMLAVFCEQELGADGPVLAATLLQGFANESANAGAGLGQMAAHAARHPELVAALRAGRTHGLAGLGGGEEFIQQFDAFIEAYGWRADEWCTFQMPTWAEDPTTPMRLIARYLEDPEHDPEHAHQRAISLREESAKKIAARLSPAKQDEFQELLEAALAHVAISEERALWQLVSIGSIRVPLLALGRKLAEAGVIAEPDGVFFLRLAELQTRATSPAPMHDAVQQRRADLERYQRLEAPQSIGAPFVVEDRPGPSQIIHRFFFGSIPVPSDETTIRGRAASQGVVTGRARIVRNLSEASRLEQGDILVCRTTAPPWTPLFAIASGVVTDTGGILSHSAICAREYAIPCVVGTQVATARIPDGATITVNGTEGTVVMGSPAPD